MEVNLELEKRIGVGRARIVAIKPQFVTLAIGLNFTFKKRTRYNSWNIQINIFCIKYILSFIFNDPVRLEEQPYYETGSVLDYFNKEP